MDPRTAFLAASLAGEHPPAFREEGRGTLQSVFAVSALAVASIGVAGVSAARLAALAGGPARTVSVDRRLASRWFGWSLRPSGWELPSPWDPIAGDYRAADGWIRLHTNAPLHRDVALRVLGCSADRDTVAAVVARWSAQALEDDVVEAGGCAAALRTAVDWAAHPQGMAVGTEPVVHRRLASPAAEPPARLDPHRPLAGVRVLDLTRVLAGPVCTRFLAGLGADVLRIDPRSWDEPGVVPDVTLGKRCGRLDLRRPADRLVFEQLLRNADILVHGYRPGALERLGYGPEERAELRPGLVDAALDAYGRTGPWRHRRGFDSLVQMSSGIAATGMAAAGADHPVPLPVQALDHATGYLLASAALDGWAERRRTGRGCVVFTSLARMAGVLAAAGPGNSHDAPAAMDDADLEPEVERTVWGPARRLRPPVTIDGVPLRWDSPAVPLGSTTGRLGWNS